MRITIMYILIHSVFIIGIAFFLWRCQHNHASRHFAIWIGFVTLFAFEYELYRELLRLVSLPPEITAFRLYYLRGVYLLTGMLLREILYYAEKILDQN